MSALVRNGYPKCFIQRSAPHPSRTEHQVDGSIDTYTNEDSTRKPPNVTLPYIRGLSETIKRILEKLDVRVRFSPNQTLRQLLVKPKDPVPLHQRNGVVYRIPCGDCKKSMSVRPLPRMQSERTPESREER